MIEAALLCLSMNIYFEAQDQPVAGQVAVAQVVMNRVRDSRFPNTVCEVVYDGGELVKHTCQFSWYCDGKSDIPFDTFAWEQAQLVASAVMAGSGHVELEGVTHYHAVYVHPYWAQSMEYVAQIGDHKFYFDNM